MPSRRRFLTTVGTLGTAGIAGCAGLTESTYAPGTDDETVWPMPAYDRGFSAYNPDAAAPRDGVTERWATEIPSPSARPVVAAGTVLVPTAGALVALDLDSGDERWRHGREQPWAGAPIVDDGTAYVGFADQPDLLALDVETGEEQWRVETTGSITAAPTFTHDHDRLYVGDDTGNIYQIDPARETVTLRGAVFGPVSALAHHTSLLVGTESGEVYDLFPHHGELTGLWRRKVGGAVTALAVRDGAIYVGTFGGPTYRLQDGAHTGASQWEAVRGGTNLAAASETVVVSGGGGLRTFDGQAGEPGWTRDGQFGAAPAIAGDTVYVGGGDVGEDGHGFVAAYPLSGGTNVGPLTTGGKRWQYDVGSAVMNGVAVADGAVFAVTQDLQESPARVYALDPK